MKKSVWKNIHFGMVVHGLVWCEPDDHPFSKASIPQVSVLLFILFFKSSWRYMANSVPQPAATTFVFYGLYLSAVLLDAPMLQLPWPASLKSQSH